MVQHRDRDTMAPVFSRPHPEDTAYEKSCRYLQLYNGDPAGNRTRVTAVKGRCLKPLDHGAIRTGSVIFSRAVARQVSSALESLTSVFGMGTGGSSPLLPPDSCLSFFRHTASDFRSSLVTYLGTRLIRRSVFLV